MITGRLVKVEPYICQIALPFNHTFVHAAFQLALFTFSDSGILGEVAFAVIKDTC